MVVVSDGGASLTNGGSGAGGRGRGGCPRLSEVAVKLDFQISDSN